MNNNKKVLVLILLVTFIYLLLSVYSNTISFYYPNFKNVDLLSEIILKNKPQKKSKLATSQLFVSDTALHKVFENYLKKGTIVSFDADTLKPSLKKFNQKLLQLAHGEKVKIRIAWFGDSQIEGDLITKDVRSMLQNYFNKKTGVGFVPVTSIAGDFRQTVKVTVFGDLQADNFKSMNAESNLFLSGYSYFSNDLIVNFKDNVAKDALQKTQKWLLYGKGDSIIVTKNGDSTKYAANHSLNKILLSESTSNKQKLHIYSNRTPIYGLSSEPDFGIVLDNFSFRGISGDNLKKVSNAVLYDTNIIQSYDLVIFQYGVNLLFKPNELNFDYYERMMNPVLNKYKASLSKADFLMFSCSDRAFKYNGSWETAVGIDSLVKLQSKLAFKHDMAFYNLYESIGGKGTVVKWADSTYQLANKDYIHFNSRGATKVANLIFKALIQDYKKTERQAAKIIKKTSTPNT